MHHRHLGITGLQVPIVGFGASPLGGVFGPVETGEAAQAVAAAIDLGIDLFDVAPYYGLTRAETVLGDALSTIPRDRYTLATKVGRYGADEFDFTAERVLRSIEESLRRLRVETVDIITCHDIEFVPLEQVIGEAVPALHRARDQGKARFIGVSGLPLSIYSHVLDQVPLDTILSYCHHTLFDAGLAEQLPYLQAQRVGVINASPFAMGLLTAGPLPDWHPAGEDIRAACRAAADHCARRGASLARLSLQFSVSNPGIPTTLTGIRSRREVEQNAAWVAEPMDAGLLAEVEAILAPIRGRSWRSGRSANS
ncbi:MAG TPA: aldo/keto reductase [Chthonomonadaceae bacterium]|nr:aldo/keto reductase [Chthonomonadaceae bacterium]